MQREEEKERREAEKLLRQIQAERKRANCEREKARKAAERARKTTIVVDRRKRGCGNAANNVAASRELRRAGELGGLNNDGG